MNRSLLKFQRGVGLIEVLVTVLIISTALMGLAALQSRSLQYNQGSYFRSQANIMASDILDRLRIYTSDNAKWSEGFVNDLPPMESKAGADITRWRTGLENSLPGGEGILSCVKETRICTVTISWKNQNNSGQESEDESSFVYTAML